MNSIRRIIKPKGLGKISLDLKYDTGDIHHLTFHNIYFPITPKLLITPQTWDRDKGEYEIGHEGNCLEVIGKCSIFVWDNGNYQRTILHDPEYALTETSINQGQDGLKRFHSMFVAFSRIQIGCMLAPQSLHHIRGRYGLASPRELWSQT